MGGIELRKDGQLGPRTPVEETLSEIWSEILREDPIGIEDSFFDLGGHSLNATQVISRVRDIFRIELPIREFLDNPIIAALARSIEARRRAGVGSAELPMQRYPRTGELPLSFGQRRLWFLNQLDPGSTAYNLARAVQLRRPLNVAALQRSLSEIVCRHESLRTSFPSLNGRPIQMIAKPVPVQLRTVDLSDLAPSEREAESQRLIKQEAQRRFDLEHGPLFLATLLRMSEGEHLLLLTMHHIVSDRWSRWILTRELSTLYEAYSQGKPSPLPELPIQYADFAQWQHQWLSGEMLDSQLSFWKQRLGGNRFPMELPTDRGRPPVQTHRGSRQSVRLPQSTVAGLKSLGRTEGATLFICSSDSREG